MPFACDSTQRAPSGLHITSVTSGSPGLAVLNQPEHSRVSYGELLLKLGPDVDRNLRRVKVTHRRCWLIWKIYKFWRSRASTGA